MIKQTLQSKASELDLYKISMDNKDQDALLVTVEGQNDLILMLSNAFLQQFKEEDYRFVNYRLEPVWGDRIVNGMLEAEHRFISIRSSQVVEVVKQLQQVRQYLADRKWVYVYTLDKELQQKELYRFQVKNRAEIDLPRISIENEHVDILIISSGILTPVTYLMLSDKLLKELSTAKNLEICNLKVTEKWGFVERDGGDMFYHRASSNEDEEHVTVQLRKALREYWNTAEVAIKVHTL